MTAQSAAIDHPAKAGAEPADADIDSLAIDTIRTLAIDAVQKADSGHAGAPMAMAPIGWTLWKRYLRYDPADPAWPGRDRFVLSAGHGSMLLYALLFLAGVRRLDGHGKPTAKAAVSLKDIEDFRELGSVTAGHPEYGHTTGVEVTTGPLGQGVANSVGMAMSERWLATRYNQPGARLFDYNVYALCSDGDLMEGVASEAASLAGHLRLSNLCWLYDDNTVTIEGHTELAFNEDVAERFRAYGWATHQVDDANDSEPLGDAEIRLTKEAYGWPPDAQFLVPDGVREHLTDSLRGRGGKARAAWDGTFGAYRRAHPDLAGELETMWAGKLPKGWDADIPTFPPDAKGMATREASGKVLNAVAPKLPWLIGGSADLSPSTKTRLEFEGAGDFEPREYGGRI